MNKSEIIDCLKNENKNMDPVFIESFVDSVLFEIKSTLMSGRRVEIRGFGSFSVRDRRERQGRNPRTGEAVHVEAKKVPFFKMGKPFQRRLNGKFH